MEGNEWSSCRTRRIRLSILLSGWTLGQKIFDMSEGSLVDVADDVDELYDTADNQMKKESSLSL